MDIALHRRVAGGALIALVLVCAWVLPARATTIVDPSSYFVRTTQLIDPLRPLEHLPNTSSVMVRAAVQPVPDPVETHLGRSFDMDVAATLAAYQAQGYVLDGYAFPWVPVNPKDESRQMPEKLEYRDVPGVLLFRRDRWRQSGTDAPPDYALVFLVGEAPSYGVHLEAFNKAARCAAAYNYATPVKVAFLHTDFQCHRLAPARVHESGATRAVGLDVIGPSFSGSMQSLAIAIAGLRTDCSFADVPVLLASPSATVDSNKEIDQLKLAHPRKCDNTLIDNPIHYLPIAWDLPKQFSILLEYLCTLPGTKGRRIAVLAEESTFGRGAETLFGSMTNSCPGDAKGPSVRVYPFSPNIASIRAERSTLRRATEPQVPGMPKATGRLLELDMTTNRETLDRPIVYESSLSSRSDELMLFRMFDSLRIRRKPDVVVILATDVRDRLFLLSQVRDSLPAALPVMLELDYLGIHPDYRATSRGAIVIPAGDAMVCLRLEIAGEAPEAQEKDAGALLVPCNWSEGKRFRAFWFPTDSAANTFRASVLLLQDREPGRIRSADDDMSAQIKSSASLTPCLYTATLAGFNELRMRGSEACDRTWEDDRKSRSSMVAADTRVTAQMPAYLGLVLLSSFFLMVAGWVSRQPCEARILLSANRYILLDGRWLQRAWSRTRRRWKWVKRVRKSAKAEAARTVTHTAPAKRSRKNALSPAKRMRRTLRSLLGLPPRARSKRIATTCEQLNPDRVQEAMAYLFVGATYALVLAIVGWMRASDDYALAHGRDPIALVCLWFLYGCFCVLAFARMKLADHRIGSYINHFAPAHMRHPLADKPPAWSWAIPMVATALVLLVVFVPMGLPTSVDPGVFWWIGLLVLAFGVAFLVNFGRLLRLIGRVTLFVSGALPQIRARQGMKEWPKPQVVLVAPQTPFNLTLLRHRDVQALRHATAKEWGKVTCSLVDRGKPGMSDVEFLKWQEQLVAELKTYVVAMRSCAWCAILAPITVLIGLSVYSPIFERRFTTLAVVLLIASFSYIVYAVLRLEQDPILGPMFTRDGDKLTFGGGLRALWPKFVAMGVVLLPLVLPSIWGWLHGLIRSVNSFT